MHSDYFRLLSDYFLPILPLFFPQTQKHGSQNYLHDFYKAILYCEYSQS